MIGDFFTVPRAQDDFPDFHVPREHLVEMSTLTVSLSAWFYCCGKSQLPKLLGDVRHVVIEVTTHDYRSIRVLSDDVPHNFCHSHSPLLQVLLFPWLEITVQNLDIVVAELYLSPAEVCPCLLYTSPSPRDRQKSRMPSSA